MLSCFPPSFWKLDKKDALLFTFSLVVQISIILAINPEIIQDFKNYQKYKFLFYQDSIISMFLAKNLFKTNQEALSPISSFCTPLQFHGIFIRFFISIFYNLFSFLNNNTKLNKNELIHIKIRSALYGQVVSIFIASFIVCYVFRRLVSIFRICNYKTQKGHNNAIISTTPFILTLLLSIVPSRFSFLRSCATSDSLFFALICFTLIFYNISSLISTLLFVVSFSFALLTRFEGVVLVPVFVIISFSKLFCYFISKFTKKSRIQETSINNKALVKETAKIENTKISKNYSQDQNSKEKNNENDKNENEDENIRDSNNDLSNIIIDRYDDESTYFLISLIVKLVSILIIASVYYWIFMNFGERPFTFDDFVSHFIFPYQMSNEKPGKNKKDPLISYPFKIIFNYIGTISNLRQSHALFSVFFPLLFSGALLITSRSSKPSDPIKIEKISYQPRNELNQNSQKADEQAKNKEEKNHPRQSSYKNKGKTKNIRNFDQIKDKNKNNDSSLKETQNKEIVVNNTHSQINIGDLPNSPFLPCYHEITADFMRQLGVLVLAFAITASCVTNGGVFRILVPAQAFAYPILLEMLVNHFLQLIFSTSSVINSLQQKSQEGKNNENNQVDAENEKKIKNLKIVSLSEKFVFICGSLFVFIGLITWDCLYARREAQRYVFSSNLWYNFVTN